VNAISALWRRSGKGDPLHLLLGQVAREDAFRALAPGREVIHLATHSFFHRPEENSPSRSQASLASGLRSGLALAGANDAGRWNGSGDNGLLAAGEVGSLNLEGVDLVVLSACNSGDGETGSAEGVFGLRRSFQVAGARTLVMSLWPVPDRGTRDWMQVFYGELWGRGLGTAAAAASASRRLLAERRNRDGFSTHPFHWGGFVSVGDFGTGPGWGRSEASRH
jgi:CHAT domain-containing protein